MGGRQGGLWGGSCISSDAREDGVVLDMFVVGACYNYVIYSSTLRTILGASLVR